MDSLGLEFQVVVSSVTSVPGTESRSSGKADNILDYRAISLSLPSVSFQTGV